jgi:hypothetical protein
MMTRFTRRACALFCTLVLCAAFAACSRAPEPVNFGIEKRHYGRLKLKARPEVWEDGMRTSLDPGQFEWWYVDAHLDDGSVAVIVFYTRPMVGIDSPAVPLVTVSLTDPDGTRHGLALRAPQPYFRASRDRCDVAIGDSRITGDLKNYHVVVKMKAFSCDLSLKGRVPSWRPATGYSFYGKEEKNYFAWLCAVPYGDISGTMEFQGKKRAVRGSGYHDHNWGNVELNKILNDWWWTRAQIGGYTVITSEMMTTKRYGKVTMPVFLLARGSDILLEDGRKMTLERSGAFIHPVSGKIVENHLVFTYSDPARNQLVRYTLDRKSDILVFDMLRAFPAWKAALARLVGVRPWYHRILGDAGLQVDMNGKKERLKATTVYELMFLGDNIERR